MNLGQCRPKWGPKLGFLLPELANHESLQQLLTFRRGRINEKTFWPKFGPKGPKMDPKLGFLPFSQVVFISFPWNCILNNHSLQHCIISSRSKTYIKIFGHQIWTKRAKNRHKTMFFCHVLKLSSLVFLEIVCNHSLQHCIISSRSKTHKKNFGHQIWAKRAKNGPYFLPYFQVSFISFSWNSMQQ